MRHAAQAPPATLWPGCPGWRDTALPGSAATAVTVADVVFNAQSGRHAGEHLRPQEHQASRQLAGQFTMHARSGHIRSVAQSCVRARHRRFLWIVNVSLRWKFGCQVRPGSVPTIAWRGYQTLLRSRSAPLAHSSARDSRGRGGGGGGGFGHAAAMGTQGDCRRNLHLQARNPAA
jgi:hypothetical protein